MQFLQHTKERDAASIDLGNADATDSIFLENRFSPEDSNFFGPTLEAEKSIKVLLMVDLTFVLFFLQNMKEHPFALWNQFSKKAKVSVGHKITCSSNFGEKSLKGLHCFSANTPSVLTLQQC